MSRPLAFWLLPTEWTAIYEAEDSLRLRVDELREHSVGWDRVRAAALIETCADDLRRLWQPYVEELSNADPRCAETRAAFAAAPEAVVMERGRWMGTDEGIVFVRYADSTPTEDPLFVFIDELYGSRPHLFLVGQLPSE